MRYKILESKYMYTLMERVQEHIDGGWRPQGGVGYQPIGMSDKWYQAMVKE
jgi:Domain of unknown function (DUF1737)